MAASSSSMIMMMMMMMVMPLMVIATESVQNNPIPQEGEEYLLECEGEQGNNMAFFLLHQKGDALPVGYHDSLQIEVFENATVYFKSINVSHEGTHLCLRSLGGRLQGYETPLRVRPLPPTELWEEVYQTKFVTGLIAALVVLAIFVLGTLVYKYRWLPPAGKDRAHIITSAAYANPAMDSIEDMESNLSTKM